MRAGSLVVGVIVLLFALYLFLDARNTLDCLGSTYCILQRGIIPGGSLSDPYGPNRNNAYIQEFSSVMLGIIGLALLGYGAGGSKPTPQVTYQQSLPQQSIPSTPTPTISQPASSPAKTNFCPNCGTPFSTDSKFCGQCGRERK